MSTTTTASDPRTVTLKGVRFSFTEKLYEKKATVENGVPKHGLNIIIETDPSNPRAARYAVENKAKAIAAMEAACEQAFKNKDAHKLILEEAPKRVCLRKGERFKNKEGQIYKGYEGNLGLSCSTPGGGQRRPRLKDRHQRDVSENDILDVFYGGTYGDAVISFYGTEKGGRGVFCTAEILRSWQEGEAMGGRNVSYDPDEFDSFEDDDAFGNAASAGDNDDLLG